METPLTPAVVEALASLSEAQQLEVIAQAKKAKTELTAKEKRDLLQELAGSISVEAGAEMMTAIDEACGQINHASWK